MKKILFIFYFFFIAFLFAVPLQAHAQDWGACLDKNQVPTLQCLPIVFSNLVNAALIFVGTVAVFLFIYAGILYIRSGGDPKQTQTARQTITYAIIGLVLVLSSYGIISLVAYVTGEKCITSVSVGNTGCNSKP